MEAIIDSEGILRLKRKDVYEVQKCMSGSTEHVIRYCGTDCPLFRYLPLPHKPEDAILHFCHGVAYGATLTIERRIP